MLQIKAEKKVKMKARISVIAAAALLLAACSPMTYPIQLEMRHPSASGLNLSGKSIAIGCMSGTGASDSLFTVAAASGLARTLEADYFGGEEVIPIFQVPQTGEISMELMMKYFMDSGQDVFFLMGAPEYGSVSLGVNSPARGVITTPDSAFVAPCTVPFSLKMWVFDSLEGKDTFHSYKGGSTIKINVYNNGMLTGDGLMSETLRQAAGHADRVGIQLGGSFVSTWKLEQYSLYYYDDYSTQDWFKPLDEAEKFNWTKAVDLWTPFLKSRDYQKRACASYNIAVAFYMRGDYELALRWLDQADRFGQPALSPGLRKRILERSGK